MISRVAEHCFWLGRYLERAENAARVLEVNHTLLLDFHVPVEQQWQPLLIISGIHDFDQEPTAENIQSHMTWSEDNAFSIRSSLHWARENARVIREVISAEMWERMNYYHLWLQSASCKALYNTNRSEFYAQVRRINQLLHGISDATMNHGEAWDFFKLGTYLERACHTARILDVRYHMLLPALEDVGTPIDSAHWMAILKSCSGHEAFHKKSRMIPADLGIAVAEFLIFDQQFPRSIKYCLKECMATEDRIEGTPWREKNEADQLLSELVQWLNERDIYQVIRDGLHEGLTHIVDTTHAIGQAIHTTYFDVTVRPAQFSQNQSQNQNQTQSQNS